MRAWLHANLGLVAGVVVGTVVVVVLVAAGVVRGPAAARPAAADFVEAWRRSRSGTFVVDGEVTRHMASGAELRSAYRLVQAPPNRLYRQFGSTDGTVDGRGVSCTERPDGSYDCTAAPDQAPAFDAALDAEIEDLREHFAAPAVYDAYDVGEGCFELEQRRAQPLPTFGTRARLCFDAGTGALVYSRRQLEGAVETSEADTVRTEVRPGDFATSDSSEFDARRSGPPEPATTSPP
jgi:hypothetical protein